MANYSDKRLEQIWDKGQTIRGKNPDLYRMDKLGNMMYRHSYGKTSEMGWMLTIPNPNLLVEQTI